MRLHSLTVEQFRQFREPFGLAELTPGINLITGPNESGKSTLVQAIRSAFFERYSSSKMEHLQPWGDSSAAPSVTLVFETDGQQWQLDKRYLKKKRCDLLVDGSQYSNEEAEDKLAQLLGFQYAGRGASKAEHWGIPGLLWVEQGAGQTIEEPVSHAGDHLQSALNSLLGEVASSGGDDVIRTVEKQREELLTKAGKPRAEYEAVIQRSADLRADLEETEQRIRNYQAAVDRLAELQEAHRAAERDRPWEEQKKQARAAQQQLASIEAWQRELDQSRRLLEQQEALLKGRQQQQADDAKQAEKLAEREKAKQEARDELEKLQAGNQQLTETIDEARATYDIARRTLDRARAFEHYSTLKARHAELGESLRAQEEALAKANKLKSELASARAIVRANPIEKAQLDAMLATKRQLSDAHIRLEAIATRLHYDLQEGATLSLDGSPLQGQGEALLTEAGTIELPAIGTLRIVPGGTDINELQREKENLEAELSRQLAELELESVEAAQRGHAEREKAEGDIRRIEDQLSAHAPKGVDALGEAVSSAREERDRLAAQLQELPQPEAVDIAPAEAQDALDVAQKALGEAEQLQTEHRVALSTAQERHRTAEQEWAALRDEIQSEGFQQRQAKLAAEIDETRQAVEKLTAENAEKQAQIDAAQPELLQQDLERFSRSAEILEREHRERELDIKGLQSTLQSQGAEGLEEKRDALAAELAHAERRCEELQRRAEALDLLLELLQERRQELTRRLQAPLQKHLDRYLGILFPDARLDINEQLIPQHFSRNGEYGEFDDLSHGAREQLGLISRLAYADLLQEAGRPTLIILDDTLVHSDRKRLEPMKRVLFDAAQRHQILLFTCHPESWQDLGVEPRELTAMKQEALRQ
ncbi:MAG: AAA family ATPase [Halioglobus sp.]|nr:AAA family ATPase [Halioglobus sp.]